MKKSALSVAILSAAIAGSVFAHGAYARFGGALAEVDDMYFELVNKNGSGTIYVTEDHESEVSTKGASGKLVVTNAGKKTEVPLQASGANTLDTKRDAKLVAGAKAEATITFADKKTVKVSFVSK